MWVTVIPRKTIVMIIKIIIVTLIIKIILEGKYED